MPNPVSRTSPVEFVEQDIGRLDVLVDEPALVQLTESVGDVDREAQEAPHLHGLAEQPAERLAARVLEHQHGPTGIAHELQRPRRPRLVELILEFVFMRESIEARAGRLVGGRQNDQHGAPVAIIVQAPPFSEDAFAVLPQNLRDTVQVRAVLQMRRHLSNSGVWFSS